MATKEIKVRIPSNCLLSTSPDGRNLECVSFNDSRDESFPRIAIPIADIRSVSRRDEKCVCLEMKDKEWAAIRTVYVLEMEDEEWAAIRTKSIRAIMENVQVS